MNTKIAAGVGGLVIGFIIGAIFLRPSTPASPSPSVSVSMTGTTTAAAPATSSPRMATAGQGAHDPSQPTFTIGKQTTTVVHSYASFDANSFTSTSTYPTVTGTAEIPKVTIVIYNSAGIGVIGTSDIFVHNGRWSYASSVALKPGTYSARLLVGTSVKSATLIVE